MPSFLEKITTNGLTNWTKLSITDSNIAYDPVTGTLTLGITKESYVSDTSFSNVYLSHINSMYEDFWKPAITTSSASHQYYSGQVGHVNTSQANYANWRSIVTDDTDTQTGNILPDWHAIVSRALKAKMAQYGYPSEVQLLKIHVMVDNGFKFAFENVPLFYSTVLPHNFKTDVQISKDDSISDKYEKAFIPFTSDMINASDGGINLGLAPYTNPMYPATPTAFAGDIDYPRLINMSMFSAALMNFVSMPGHNVGRPNPNTGGGMNQWSSPGVDPTFTRGTAEENDIIKTGGPPGSFSVSSVSIIWDNLAAATPNTGWNIIPPKPTARFMFTFPSATDVDGPGPYITTAPANPILTSAEEAAIDSRVNDVADLKGYTKTLIGSRTTKAEKRRAFEAALKRVKGNADKGIRMDSADLANLDSASTGSRYENYFGPGGKGSGERLVVFLNDGESYTIADAPSPLPLILFDEGSTVTIADSGGASVVIVKHADKLEVDGADTVWDATFTIGSRTFTALGSMSEDDPAGGGGGDPFIQSMLP